MSQEENNIIECFNLPNGNLINKYDTFDIKDKEGKKLYSMMFLLKIEEGMKEYQYGDLEFKRRYGKSIIMQSVYDKRLIDYFKGTLWKCTYFYGLLY